MSTKSNERKRRKEERRRVHKRAIAAAKQIWRQRHKEQLAINNGTRFRDGKKRSKHVSGYWDEVLRIARDRAGAHW